ncbi:MAG: hypothetical protein UY17_C0020G0003 [Candidatus Beckwithbacteria bacterium GW2011_GWC2_47_9]|uniref:Kelch repeat type 1-containing protein n=1 Tax=Candidatus Beckwithbacteria bacterium GW2011_GWC2_47_9 TaxID=1618373 RepID=A0A0G1TZU7_9BACT|nr:MAG: hypothetical protein UY17_C0020G0003 [Candidatus Beckwithbacteria bacterium GW2011_GWC2_47_9]
MTSTKGIVFLASVVVLSALTSWGMFFRSRFPPAEMPLVFPQSAAEKKREIPFRPEDLVWQEISSSTPWTARDSHAATVFQGKIWLTGGLNANDVTIRAGRVEYEKAQYFNDIWYSEDGAHWKRVVEHAPWPPRRSQQLVVFKGKLWLVGGWGPKDGYAKEIWTSGDGLSWQKIIPGGGLPEIEGHQLIVFKDKLWLFGGVRYTDRKLVNEVWYTDDGLNWTLAVKNAPWPGRWDHTVTEFKGVLWLAGGMDLADNEFNDVWRSEDGFHWERVTGEAPWSARQGHVALVYREYLWVIGQLNDTPAKGKNDVWFSQDGYEWKKTIRDPVWLGREDHEALVFKDAIWVFGGMTSDWKWSNEVWRSSVPGM